MSLGGPICHTQQGDAYFPIIRCKATPPGPWIGAKRRFLLHVSSAASVSHKRPDLGPVRGTPHDARSKRRLLDPGLVQSDALLDGTYSSAASPMGSPCSARSAASQRSSQACRPPPSTHSTHSPIWSPRWPPIGAKRRRFDAAPPPRARIDHSLAVVAAAAGVPHRRGPPANRQQTSSPIVRRSLTPRSGPSGASCAARGGAPCRAPAESENRDTPKAQQRWLRTAAGCAHKPERRRARSSRSSPALRVEY